MPDAYEGIREHVKNKPADELIRVYRQQLEIVVVSTISIPEVDQAIFDFHYSRVGDGYTMSVVAKIIKHLLGTIERRFGVNDPVFFERVG